MRLDQYGRAQLEHIANRAVHDAGEALLLLAAVVHYARKGRHVPLELRLRIEHFLGALPNDQVNDVTTNPHQAPRLEEPLPAEPSGQRAPKGAEGAAAGRPAEKGRGEHSTTLVVKHELEANGPTAECPYCHRQLSSDPGPRVVCTCGAVFAEVRTRGGSR